MKITNKTNKIFSGLALLGLLGSMTFGIRADHNETHYTIPAGESAEFGCENGSSRELKIVDGEPVLITCHEDGTVTVEPSPSATATVTEVPSTTEAPTDVSTETSTATEAATLTQTASATASASKTITPSFTVSPTNTTTLTPTRTASATPSRTRTPTAPPTATQPSTGNNAPFRGAPLCATHDPTKWHGLWDGTRGCHYDHEHGTNPFTPAVSAAFPGFDLKSLIGNVEVGHSNPSSPMEFTHKHGGWKWESVPQTPQGCVIGFEAATVCVTAAVVGWHTWGDLSQELEADVHSSVFLIRQGAGPDYGYVFGVQFQEYGENCAPYQGFTLPYPQNFIPEWDCAFGQYWSVPCAYDGLPECAETVSVESIRASNRDASAVVTSKRTGNTSALRPRGSSLFNLLFRVRDNYQTLDSRDLVHPFTYLWICSNDGGQTYAPQGCRYNNSAATVHEVTGFISSALDNLPGFDTNPVRGRITAEGFVNRFGDLNMACNVPDVGQNADDPEDCFPVKFVNAFVGKWGGELSAGKVSDDRPDNTPDVDIYFCRDEVCSETSPGAVPSGWFGPNN
jgi:hypothetical protein